MKSSLGMGLRGVFVFVILSVIFIIGSPGIEIAGAADGFMIQADLVAQWPVEGQPDGIAVGPDGSVYVNINNSHRVVGYTAVGEKFTEWLYEGDASGIAVSPSGQVWVTLNNNYRETEEAYIPPRVIGYSPTGEVLAQWSAECAGCQESETSGLAAGPDGSIYVNINNSHREIEKAENLPQVIRYDSLTGEILAQWPVEESPDGLAVGPDGRVFVNINNSHRVVGYTAVGEKFTEWLYEGEASGLTVSPLGQVWVTINNSHRAVGYGVDGTLQTGWTFEGQTVGLAAGAEGMFYLADPEAQVLRVYQLP